MHRALQRYTPRQRQAAIAAMAAPATPRPLATLRLLCVPYNSPSHLRHGCQASDLIGTHRVIFRQGCFGDSVNDDIPLWAQHDGGRQIKDAKLRFDDLTDGLYATVTLPHTALARQVLRNAEYGIYRGVSISERLGDSGQYSVYESDGCRILDIKKTDLLEVSIVTEPSFPGTFVSLI